MTFSKDVKGWLNQLVLKKRPPYRYRVLPEATLIGKSGCQHRIDFAISTEDVFVQKSEVNFGWVDKILVEVKAQNL